MIIVNICIDQKEKQGLFARPESWIASNWFFLFVLFHLHVFLLFIFFFPSKINFKHFWKDYGKIRSIYSVMFSYLSISVFWSLWNFLQICFSIKSSLWNNSSHFVLYRAVIFVQGWAAFNILLTEMGSDRLTKRKSPCHRNRYYFFFTDYCMPGHWRLWDCRCTKVSYWSMLD